MALPVHPHGWPMVGILVGFGLIGWSIASDEPQLDVPPAALQTARAFANSEPAAASAPTAAPAPIPPPATRPTPHAPPSTAATPKSSEAKPPEPKPPPVEEKKLDTLEALAGTWT